MSKYKHELMLLFVVLSWASGMLAAKAIVTGFDPVPGNTVRYAMAAAFQWGYAHYSLRRTAARRETFFVKGTFWTAMLMSAFIVASQLSTLEALKHTSATNATFIGSIYTMLVPVFGALFFRERVRPVQVIGLAGCLVGTCLISGVLSFSGGLHFSLSSIGLGDALMLVSAVSAASQVITVGRSGKKGFDPLGFSAAQMTGTCLTLLLLWGLFFRDAKADFSNPWALFGCFFSGLVGSGIANIFFCTAMAHIEPAAAGLLLGVQPFVTMLLAAVIPIAGRTEPITAVKLAGGAIIVGAIMATQFAVSKAIGARPKEALEEPRPPEP
ncbi:MAG TPA: DMT family transporter [Terriglobales bacterium]|nr:DMT family transporter [Terriglobales bacterium]